MAQINERTIGGKKLPQINNISEDLITATNDISEDLMQQQILETEIKWA